MRTARYECAHLNMSHQEIRKKFRDFFESRGHKWIESSSLLPDDPSVLFTTAGMQQFKPYYTGQADAMKDLGSLNTVSIQKSMRTSDIDEVGDEFHLTFFEMMGNFSFGDYGKEEAIKYGYEFIIKELGLTIDYVSVFGGEDNIPADSESENIWKSIDPKLKIKKSGKEDNFWGPTGNEGPCGPTTEIYIDGTEIWNIVFNEYYCDRNKNYAKLDVLGIDTGMGLERLAMVVQGKKNIFETDLFAPVISTLTGSLDVRSKRIVADHTRASIFLIYDSIRPSNKEQGYVLRRLMRRVLTYEYLAHEKDLKFSVYDILDLIIRNYQPIYPDLVGRAIADVWMEETERFYRTLKSGLKELNKNPLINAEIAFRLYESYGLPYEIIKDISAGKNSNLTRADFDEEFKKHQEKSRAGAEKKFGGHGLLMDTGELKAGNEEELKKATRLHTATHLLHAALRKILGREVKQAGSDITAERLRFDFSFHRKMTSEEIKQVEDMVNEAVKKDYKVTKEEMSYEDAVKLGTLAFFKQKYPEKVNVYSIGDFSKELCGGPHVSNTGEIGHVKIMKEESVSASVRRIRAVVE